MDTVDGQHQEDVVAMTNTSNVVLGLSAAAAAAAATGVLYRAARRRFPVAVNCWFCGADARVAYDDANAWTCPQCEQYNGFDKDGGYNKEMDFVDDGSKRYAVERAVATKSNGLCHTCNLNQDLKVTQLANFIPENPRNYDQEAKEYEAYLNRTYRLCRTCKWIIDSSRQCMVIS